MPQQLPPAPPPNTPLTTYSSSQHPSPRLLSRNRPQTRQTPQAPSGSQTITQTSAPHSHPPTLRLRAEEVEEQSAGEPARRIQWAEGTVDNEGLGRKKSKVCCIYHRPKGVDESSDESSSESDDSDTEAEGRDKGAHGHAHGGACGSKKKKRSTSPNAYENVRHLRRGGGS